MRVAFDSSALAKRYVLERGSDRVAELCARAEEVILSVVCIPEILSALNRLRRERLLTRNRYVRIKRALAADVEQATVLAITPPVLGRTVAALEKAPLRALDAIHVATGLDSACELFVSADKRQCDAARKMGLTVELVGA